MDNIALIKAIDKLVAEMDKRKNQLVKGEWSNDCYFYNLKDSAFALRKKLNTP